MRFFVDTEINEIVESDDETYILTENGLEKVEGEKDADTEERK